MKGVNAGCIVIVCVFLCTNIKAVAGADGLVFGNALACTYALKDYIAELYSHCEPDTFRSPVPGGRTFIRPPCGANVGPVIERFLRGEPPEVEDGPRQFILAVFHLVASASFRSDQRSSVLMDSSAIAVLIAFLSDTTEVDISGVVCEKLLLRTSRAQLARQGELLAKAVAMSELLPHRKRHLVLLGGLDSTRVHGVVDMTRASLAERARLGDRAAEDSLVAAYDRARGYRDKARLVEELAYTGTRKCLSHLILHFNEPVFAIVGTNNCVNKTIRSSIVHALVPYHPEAGVLNARLRDMRTVCDSAVVEQYCDDFIAWAYSTYGVRPVDPRPPHGILENYCTVDMDRPGQYIGCRERARLWPKRTPSR